MSHWTLYKLQALSTMPLPLLSDRECQVKHWCLSHKSDCKNDLIRYHEQKLAEAYQLVETRDFERDLRFWKDLAGLHCHRWGVSSLVEFVRDGPRGEQEVTEAFFIYKYFANTATVHNEEGLALQLFQEMYDVMEEACVQWTEKYSITVNYASKIAHSENDRKYDEAIRILRKYIQEATEALAKERRGRGRDLRERHEYKYKHPSLGLAVIKEYLAYWLSQRLDDCRQEVMQLVREAEEVARKAIRRGNTPENVWSFQEAASVLVGIGRVACSVNEFAVGEEILLTGLEAAKELSSARLTEKATMALARLYERRPGRLKDAENLYRQSLTREGLTCRSYGDYTEKISLLLFKQGKWDEAVHFRRQSMTEIPSLLDLESVRELLFKRMFLDSATLHEEAGKVGEAATFDKAAETFFGYDMDMHMPPEQLLVYWRRKGRYAVKMNDRAQALNFYGIAMAICIHKLTCDCNDATQLTIYEELKKLLLEEREEGGGPDTIEYLQEIESRDEALRNRWNQKWDDALEELRQETRKKRPNHNRSGRKKKRQQGRGVKGHITSGINEDQAGIEGKSESAIETSPAEDLEVLECAICLMDIEEDDEEEENNHAEAATGNILILKCSHKFHGWCLTDWFAKCEENGWILSCPKCRSEPLTNAMDLCGHK